MLKDHSDDMKTTTRIILCPLVGLALLGCEANRPATSSLPLARAAVRGGPEGVPDEAPSDVTTSGRAAESDAAAVLFVEFVATPQDVVDRMLELAAVTKDDVVCDLGCGDGRIVITAARRYGCRAIGYDLDLLRVREARASAARNGVAHLVRIEQRDVLKADLQDVSVVMLYLGPELNARLIPLLQKLRPGARIVSHEFPLGALAPAKMVQMTSRTDGRKHAIHLWSCPLTPEGR
jgi:precorrin-6B methylase 2